MLRALRDSRALLDGHFLLSSGRHGGAYVQCALLLQYPDQAQAACADLAAAIRARTGEARPCATVIGPALGAVTLAYELGRALGARALFAERAAEGGFTLRRGFSVAHGEPVLVAEDVVTTGKSVNEVIEALRAAQARVVGVASLVNRSGQERPFGELPYHRLLDLDIPSWAPEDCPLCRAGGPPPVKPGSRPGSR
ncbi:MAG: orotate phosphoribosyltransferase [Planctomycetota bacterium]|nr:MAG: orotate phosphoribosyltransferase [Planctomycetota bacterium]